MTQPAARSTEEVNSDLCACCQRVMEGLLRALGFENKPDYLEKIPETLTGAELDVHKVFGLVMLIWVAILS